MDNGTLFLHALGRADGTLRRALEGLTRAELVQQPTAQGSTPLVGWRGTPHACGTAMVLPFRDRIRYGVPRSGRKNWPGGDAAPL